MVSADISCLILLFCVVFIAAVVLAAQSGCTRCPGSSGKCGPGDTGYVCSVFQEVITVLAKLGNWGS